MKLALAILFVASVAHADVDAMVGFSSQRRTNRCSCGDTYGGAAALGASARFSTVLEGEVMLWMFEGGGAGTLGLKVTLDDRVWLRGGLGFGYANHDNGDGDDGDDTGLLLSLDAGVVLERHGRFATTANVGLIYFTDDTLTPVVVAGLGLVFR